MIPTQTDPDFIKTARILGYLGLLPFIGCLVGLLLIQNETLVPHIINAVMFYSAIIIVFISAVHWGAAISSKELPNASQTLIMSIVPSILAWIFLMLSPKISLACFFFGFLLWRRYEEAMEHALAFPEWYTLLRKQLSYAVAAMLLLTWLVCFNL